MKLVRFNLIVVEGESLLDVNPEHVESIFDATPFQKGVKCTQIQMISGRPLFVKETLEEVKEALLKGSL